MEWVGVVNDLAVKGGRDWFVVFFYAPPVAQKRFDLHVTSGVAAPLQGYPVVPVCAVGGVGGAVPPLVSAPVLVHTCHHDMMAGVGGVRSIARNPHTRSCVPQATASVARRPAPSPPSSPPPPPPLTLTLPLPPPPPLPGRGGCGGWAAICRWRVVAAASAGVAATTAGGCGTPPLAVLGPPPARPTAPPWASGRALPWRPAIGTQRHLAGERQAWHPKQRSEPQDTWACPLIRAPTPFGAPCWCLGGAALGGTTTPPGFAARRGLPAAVGRPTGRPRVHSVLARRPSSCLPPAAWRSSPWGDGVPPSRYPPPRTTTPLRRQCTRGAAF